jgi:CheY-like chemotaxis protein
MGDLALEELGASFRGAILRHLLAMNNDAPTSPTAGGEGGVGLEVRADAESEAEVPLALPLPLPVPLLPIGPDTLHLLVVDDMHLFRALCARFLNRLGCTFAMLEDGERVEETLAAAAASGRAFDCILLDTGLPRRSGTAVCAALRAKNYLQPIIAMTAADSDDERAAYYDTGFDVILPKPLSQDGVRSALLEALQRRGLDAKLRLHPRQPAEKPSRRQPLITEASTSILQSRK